MYLVTSDLSLSGEAMVKLYKLVTRRGWSIEECHKSLKQNVALEKAPKQKTNTQTNHFFASLYGYLKLEKLKLAMGSNHFAMKKLLLVKAAQGAFATLKELYRSHATELKGAL